MIYKKVVGVGDKVTFSKDNGQQDQNSEIRQYTSKVLDLIGDDKAVVALPMENGRVIPLSIGEKYWGFFYTASGMFQCNCEIIERYKDDNIYVMIVQFISAFEKYQRRQYFRLDMLKDLEFRPITMQEKVIEKKVIEDEFDTAVMKAKFVNTLNAMQSVWHPAVITDLSGGGMRFNTNADRGDEKEIVVKLDFSVGGKDCSYILKADIIQVSMMPNKPGFDEYRVRFSDITKEQRENVIKYIFEEERRRRKKEMG